MRFVYLLLAAGLLAWGLTGLVLAIARRMAHVAEPTDRGLHKQPTPVGGGIGMIVGALLVFVLAYPLKGPFFAALLGSLGLLGLVSWCDDRWTLPPAIRFAAQAIAVAALIWCLPQEARIVPWLNIAVERLVLGVAWLWAINLTNFMDGIDGLAGGEAVAVGAGYALISRLIPEASPLLPHLPDLGALLAAAALGYLVWNWAPARIFMGDVGAIPLGLLFGLFMLDLALRGQWAAALILPLYFLFDATLTLLERVRRGAKPWEAHREHAYQRAVLAGLSHATVTIHVAILNVTLIALAAVSIRQPWPALVVAMLCTAALWLWLRQRLAKAR